MLFNTILRKNILSGVLFFVPLIVLQGKPFFKMNDKCLSAQTLIYELRLDEAKAILAEEQVKSPENIAVPWLQEYCLFLTHFIAENEKDFKAANTEWEKYIATAEKLKTGDAWYGFILSDMHLHRASVKLKMNENITAGNDIKKANHLLKINESSFPDFLPDNKNAGMIDALFSAIPDNYKWLGRMLGFDGNLKEGLAKIEKYLNSDLNENEHRCLKLETAFIYSLLQHHFQKNNLLAWNTIDKYTGTYKQNLLVNYMRATIAGNCGYNDEMIRVLSARPSGKKTVPFYYMDYMLGIAKLRRLDKDADQYLKIYTVKFKGQNYIKSAYRYLAWSSIIKGDNTTAATYYSLCKKNGKAYQEEDIQAQKEAAETRLWEKEILRCRLLFDGHYYVAALSLLNTFETGYKGPKKFELELMYRKARIYMETKDFANALLMFDKVISNGKNESYYYAAYSALYMAAIYEELRNPDQAAYYYNKAKDDFPDNKEYRNSIEQKARLGLKRLKK